jgi:hypothetical protein
VLVVREGSGWVVRQDGTREPVSAKTVITDQGGEWVEFGSDESGDAFVTELYAAASLSEEQEAVRLARVLNPAAR